MLRDNGRKVVWRFGFLSVRNRSELFPENGKASHVNATRISAHFKKHAVETTQQGGPVALSSWRHPLCYRKSVERGGFHVSAASDDSQSSDDCPARYFSCR